MHMEDISISSTAEGGSGFGDKAGLLSLQQRIGTFFVQMGEAASGAFCFNPLEDRDFTLSFGARILYYCALSAQTYLLYFIQAI